MAKISEIRDYFNSVAPFYMALGFDNVGLLIGRGECKASKVLVSLDITSEVIEEAKQYGAELIITHHPVIFNPVKSVTDEDVKGKQLLSLIENHIAVISLHTNMDSADGGVNDCLIKALGAEKIGLVAPHGNHPDGSPFGITRFGNMPEEMDLLSFLTKITENLGVSGLRYYDSGRRVKKIACCGGAGSGDLEAVYKLGCDTYITADVKYDTYLWAKEAGINIIDADHFCTENVVVPFIADTLRKGFSDIEIRISEKHTQTLKGF